LQFLENLVIIPGNDFNWEKKKEKKEKLKKTKKFLLLLIH